MGKHFHQRPNRSFGTNSDEMPGRGADRRSKLVHQQGMVAQVEYRNTLGLHKHELNVSSFQSNKNCVLSDFSFTGDLCIHKVKKLNLDSQF